MVCPKDCPKYGEEGYKDKPSEGSEYYIKV
jgi:hypothetical protein